MNITAISDLHGHLPELPGGDLLIVAGDLTARDRVGEYYILFDWLELQPYEKKVIIAGNHDGLIEKHSIAFSRSNFTYLQDTGTEFMGYKIWGSPWTPPFQNWHFMLPAKEIAAKWDLIPDDTDILITHGPPFRILDDNADVFPCGCPSLRARIEVVQPKLHIFGHIHEGYGHHCRIFTPPAITQDIKQTNFYNVAIMDGDYRPVNPPTRIIL